MADSKSMTIRAPEAAHPLPALAALPRRRPRSLSADEAGVAYIELAFILLPCILTIIFATFECSNLLYLKQGVTFVAKEAASYAFRECSPYEDAAARQSCVMFVQGRMEAFGRNALSPLSDDMDLIVSVFESQGPFTVATLAISTNPTPSGFSSKIAPLMGTDPDLRSMMQEQDRAAVAEVNLIYRPLFPPSLALLDFAEFDFYEVAIY